ncbi:MAG: replicative DNA helicase, partial [Oscillochloris sp.]|nr:replicative DNA helicase [Oscillochloris sp.]
SDMLRSEDFYLEKHAQIYEGMLACLSRRTPPDISTVASELRRRDRLDLVGGLSFLGDLIAEVPTAVHVEYYAQAVVHTATLRRLIEAGGRVVALGYDTQATLDQTLDMAEQTIYTVSQRQRGTDFMPFSLIARQYFDEAERGEDARFAPTGLTDLDAKLGGGFRPGQLVLLAARPSMGKSGLAMSITHHLTMAQHRSVGVVSLEMSRSELTERLLAIHTGINTQDIGPAMRRGDARLYDALGALSDAQLSIEDHAGLSVMDVRSKARRLASVRPLDLLIVDYLQLLMSDTEASQTRNEEVARISRQLKLLARELQCPILALSQLSREVEKRTTKVPQLADLRDSGALEQDADVVLFIYRDDAYAVSGAQRSNAAEIHVAKQRNGPLGVVTVRFDPPTTRFMNLLGRTS